MNQSKNRLLYVTALRAKYGSPEIATIFDEKISLNMQFTGRMEQGLTIDPSQYVTAEPLGVYTFDDQPLLTFT